MKQLVITEEQEKKLIDILREGVETMPVPKKMNKPYTINPEKVLLVKKFLDGGFVSKNYEDIGNDGLRRVTPIVAMLSTTGEELKYLYKEQMVDLLISKFKDMFLDKDERELFMSRVLEDWMNGRISPQGLLPVNYLQKRK